MTRHGRRAATAFVSQLVDRLEPRRLFANVAGALRADLTHQTIDGLGAGSTGSYFAPETANASFYDKIVGDLGASGVRSGVSTNFEVVNDNNDPNVFDWSKFDSNQLKLVMQFNQRLKERGVKQFFISVYTPPWWMKTNLSANGGGTLRADMRAEFAEFVAAVVIASKRDYGIDLTAVSIQNEQVFLEPYESAQYDNITFRETLIAVQRKFAAEGLSTKVLINEDVLASYSLDRWQWYNAPALEDPEVDRSRLIIGSHTGDPAVMGGQASQLEGTGVPLWYTEVSGESPDWGGALRTASNLSDVLTKANASSYHYFLYNYPSYDATAALMSDGVPNAKYYGLKHYYKYIRPGMQRLDTSVDESGGVRLSAFRGASGESTIVLLNGSGSSDDVTINLNGANLGALRGYRSTASNYWQSIGTVNANGTLSITLPANSIMTLTSVADVAMLPGQGSVPVYPDSVIDADLDNPLREAIAIGWVGQVLDLINAGADVNAAGRNGWTPLHAAAARSYADGDTIINALLAHGANVNALAAGGLTPLHVVAMNQLLNYAVDGQTKTRCVDALVNAGADVNARDDAGRTPLIWAALTPIAVTQYNANTAVPVRLLARGANAAWQDVAGRTAYDYAVQEYKPDMVSLLAAPGVDTRGPLTRYVQFDQEMRTIHIVLTEDVTATLTAADVVLRNVQTLAGVAGWTLTTSFANGLTFADVTLPASLPDGRYELRIAPGTFADGNGVTSTMGVNLTFTRLAGDVNSDGIVDFYDLLGVAQNFNTAGKHRRDGDLNGDGRVDFSDLLILAQNYGRSV